MYPARSNKTYWHNYPWYYNEHRLCTPQGQTQLVLQVETKLIGTTIRVTIDRPCTLLGQTKLIDTTTRGTIMGSIYVLRILQLTVSV